MTIKYRVIPPNESELRSILKKYDSNGDGRLDKTELQEALAGSVFLHADHDGAGFIFAEEIDDLVKYILKWFAPPNTHYY